MSNCRSETVVVAYVTPNFLHFWKQIV